MMTPLVSLPNCRISFRKGLFSFPALINTHCFLDSYIDFAMSGEVVVQDYPCAQGRATLICSNFSLPINHLPPKELSIRITESSIFATVKVQRRDCVRTSGMRLNFPAICLPGFVMRQDVALRLPVQYIPVVRCTVDGVNPAASRVHHLNPYGSSCPAARDQHRRQAYG